MWPLDPSFGRSRVGGARCLTKKTDLELFNGGYGALEAVLNKT